MNPGPIGGRNDGGAARGGVHRRPRWSGPRALVERGRASLARVVTPFLAPVAARVTIPAIAWWVGRSRRDRFIILAGTLLFGALFVYGWLWMPAASGIGGLQRDLPRMRAQRGELLAMGEEGRRLRAEAGRSAAAVLPPEARRPAVERSLKAAGAAGAEVNAGEAANQLRLRWNDIDYGSWAFWAAGAERELGARFARVSVQGRQDTPAARPGQGGQTGAEGAEGSVGAEGGSGGSAGSGGTGGQPLAEALAPGHVRVEAVLEWRAP